MPPFLRRRTVALAACAAVTGGLLVGIASGEEPLRRLPLFAAAEAERAPLPEGSSDRGRAGVESSALALAVALDAVPVREGGPEDTRFCPQERLRVRWQAPAEGEFSVGGHIEPVGPAPTRRTSQVNGLVVCAGASYAYMGFEAHWTGSSWSVSAVPALSDEHGLGEDADAHDVDAHGEDGADVDAHDAGAYDVDAHDEHGTDERPRAAAGTSYGHEPVRQPVSSARGFSVPPVSGIDPYAAYDPQRLCDPAPKPGMVALRDLLLATYPGTRSLGVSRTCSARGVSEHKEGRAFDWGVDVRVPRERAAAESALAQLLVTDAAGHRHALARRLGVMYLIWDRRIWSAYAADRGWRPYSGANAHTDHVHISLSWDGAMGRTSYWQGDNAALLRLDPELRLAESGAGGTSSSTARAQDGATGSGAAAAAVPRASRGPAGPGTPSHQGRKERVLQVRLRENRAGGDVAPREQGESGPAGRHGDRERGRDGAGRKPKERVALTSLDAVQPAPREEPGKRAGTSSAAAPANPALAKSALTKTARGKSAPAKSAPAKSVPARSVPAKTARGKSAPAKSAPAKSAPVRSVPARSAPVTSAPAVKAPRRAKASTRVQPPAAVPAPRRPKLRAVDASPGRAAGAVRAAKPANGKRRG
jgi:hypothetical protein